MLPHEQIMVKHHMHNQATRHSEKAKNQLNDVTAIRKH